MIKRVSKLILPYVFLLFILPGCGGIDLKSKTVIINDTAESGETAAVNEAFTVNKLFKLLQNEDAGTPILGWSDNEHVMALFGQRNREPTLERVDYLYNSRQKSVDINGILTEIVLSPDGQVAAAVKNEAGSDKLMLLNINDNKEMSIEDVIDGQFTRSSMFWSNNSRYLSYVKGNRAKSEAVLTVYDVNGQNWNEYIYPRWNGKDAVTGVKISDNGESALLIKETGAQATAVYGKLKEDQFISQYEQAVSIYGNPDFVNDNQIMFIGQKGSLYIYDSRNANTAVLLEDIGTFRLSGDRKYIAYSKGREGLFAAKLQGNNVLNEKQVFKGFVPMQLEWSRDNKKLLIYGGGRPLSAQPAQSPVAVPEAFPLIIEFK